MSDILHNPPKIKKTSVEKNSQKSDYRFLIKKRKSSSGLAPSWKYMVYGPSGEKRGFAWSKFLAFLAIRLWITKQESQRKKGRQIFASQKAQEELLLLAGVESLASIPISFDRDSLQIEKIAEDVFIYSASKPLFRGSSKRQWLSGIARKNEIQKITHDARTRKGARKKALVFIKSEEKAKELDDLQKNLTG